MLFNSEVYVYNSKIYLMNYQMMIIHDAGQIIKTENKIEVLFLEELLQA